MSPLPGTRSRIAALLPAALAVAVLSLALWFSVARAQAPDLESSYPGQGDILSAAPGLIHLCFDRDVDRGSAEFALSAPGGTDVDLRPTFSDNREVELNPSRTSGEVEGDWKLMWRVRGEDGDESSGDLTFTVHQERAGESAEVVVAVKCTSDDTAEPDVLQLSLLTLAAVGGTLLVALIGYRVRNRIGFWLHRPPPRNGGGPDAHH